MRTIFSKLQALLIVGSLIGVSVLGMDVAARADEPAKPIDQAALYKKFEQSMNGVKLVGQFTVRGKENDKPSRDEYTILSATKMDNGDYWLLKARIKYGNNDLTVPLPLEVKWAGTTPVITLDNVTIPGLGTFSSRVVIDGTLYAGTWTHDKVSGHMFGTIEKLPDNKQGEKDGK